MSDAAEPLRLFAEGRLADLAPAARAHLLARAPSDEAGLVARVASLMDDVRARGDEALREMAARFDGARLARLEVPRERWDRALAGLDPAVRRALERAAANIRRFHTAQIPTDVTLEVEPGVRITRRWSPLERVGVYAPGGRAAYPSSVLMGVVPARAAGVTEVVVCSPPGSDGEPPAAVLAACALAGADRLFALGGAGAVAALAFGTRSVPAVDAIVGPGNRWVTEAKRQVAGRVLIDSPAGPSEVLVLADDTARPALVAAELLAQAEHDADAACVAVLTSMAKAGEVRAELSAQLADTPRGAIAGAALAGAGALLVADSLDEAVAFAEAYAPEHLSVMTADPMAIASRIRSAGTTFVGPWASVAFGDYMTGANHVLPTAGRARAFSGLSIHHYMRSYTVQEITAEGAAALADDVALLAAAEGLPAHAAAALARREA
ncbi:MAG: histidinol dehydrogenase [Longimicrobiales bacterium]|nr:histidinol dehydrogenase [Longimicrobiales bacterium]